MNMRYQTTWKCLGKWLLPGLLLPVMSGAEALWVDGYFGNDCVLQRDAPVRIWGGADAGEEVAVTFRGQTHRVRTAEDGRWQIECGPYVAGGPDEMLIRTESHMIRFPRISVGDVYVFVGQSNMAYNMAPQLPWTEGVPEHEAEIRKVNARGISLMTLPRFTYHEPWERVEGAWQAASPASVRHFSAVAWYTARELRERTAVPLGIIVSAIGSTGIESWMSGRPLSPERLSSHAERLDAFRKKIGQYCAGFRQSLMSGQLPDNRGPGLWKNYYLIPSGCFNALVHPLTRYPVSGWIWYQGEGNAHRAAAYEAQLTELISNYRARWNQPQTPFVVVQLPGFEPEEDKSGETWALLREAQRRVVLKTPHTALVVTLDVGDPERIHPRTKKPVGLRCAEALSRLQKASLQGYGLIPEKAVKIEQGGISVQFTGDPAMLPLAHKPGCVMELVYGDGTILAVKEIETCGATLNVTLPEGSTFPNAVRYGFSNNPQPMLLLRDGTPVSPFHLQLSHSSINR